MILLLMWSGNGQLATSSHIPRKLNRWNAPCSVTINLLEEVRGNTVILETRKSGSISLFGLDQNLKHTKIPKLIKNKIKWIKKWSVKSWEKNSIMNLHSMGRKFFTKIMQFAGGKGENQSPAGLNTVHKHVIFKRLLKLFFVVVLNKILTHPIVLQYGLPFNYIYIYSHWFCHMIQLHFSDRPIPTLYSKTDDSNVSPAHFASTIAFIFFPPEYR